MKRIIRLTESDLTRIVRRVIREQEDEWSDEDQMELDTIDKMSSDVGKLIDTDRESWEKGYDDYKSNYHDRWRELKAKKRNAGH